MILLILSITLAIADDSRIPIYVLDSGMDINSNIYCKDGHFFAKNDDLKDHRGHGHLVSQLIMKGLDNYCIKMIKYCDLCDNSAEEGDYYKKALNFLLKQKPKYLNISSCGLGAEAFEIDIITKLLKHGTIITTVAGNNGIDLDDTCIVYPACVTKHTNLHVVGCLDKKPSILNVNSNITDYENCSYKLEHGTSFAAPRIMNRILKYGK